MFKYNLVQNTSHDLYSSISSQKTSKFWNPHHFNSTAVSLEPILETSVKPLWRGANINYKYNKLQLLKADSVYRDGFTSLEGMNVIQ